nr:MAG: nonstructural protein [Riboviria sp.]
MEVGTSVCLSKIRTLPSLSVSNMERTNEEKLFNLNFGSFEGAASESNAASTRGDPRKPSTPREECERDIKNMLRDLKKLGFQERTVGTKAKRLSQRKLTRLRCRRGFIEELIEAQALQLEPAGREAFRRAAKMKAILKMKFEQAHDAEPNMFKNITASATDSAEAVKTAADAMTKRLEDPLIDSLMQNTNTCMKMIAEGAAKINDTVDTISEFIQTPDLTRFGIIAATTIAQLFMSKSYSIIFILLEIVKICAYLVPTKMASGLNSLKTFVMTSFSKKSENTGPVAFSPAGQQQAQNALPSEANAGIETTVPGLMTKFVHKSVALLTGTDEQQVKKFGTLKSLGDHGRNLHNLNMGMATIMKWVSWIFDSMHLLVTRILGHTFLTGDVRAQEFNASYCELLDVKPEDYGKKDYALRLKELNETAVQMKRDIETGKLKLDRLSRLIVDKNINRVLSHFKDNRTAILSVLSAQTARKTPYFFQFVGEPGVGKSTVMTLTAKVMTEEKNCGKFYPRDDLIFSVSKTSYKDGYRMQPVHIDDDQWQSESGTTSGTGNEYMDTISAISCTNFQVDMANLENKGMPFVCDLYIGSTNNPYPKPKDISNPEALHRRRKKLVLVASRHWRKERKLYNIDYKNEEYNQLNFLTFRFLDPIKAEAWPNFMTEIRTIFARNSEECPTLPTGWMDYRTMVKELCKDFKDHLKHSDPTWIDGKDLPTTLSDLFAEEEQVQQPADSERASSSYALAVSHEEALDADANFLRSSGEPNFGDIPTESEGDSESDDEEPFDYDDADDGFLQDYSEFRRERENHQRAWSACFYGDTCGEPHAQVCCVPRYCCDGMAPYLTHFCGKYGYYSDVDESGFFHTANPEEFDDQELGWYAILQANRISFPDHFEPVNHPHQDEALEAEANVGRNLLPWVKYTRKEEDVQIVEDFTSTADVSEVQFTVLEDEINEEGMDAILEAIRKDQLWKKRLAKFKPTVNKCLMALGACGAIGALVWMFKLYKSKAKREKTPAEKVAKVLTNVLDQLEEIEEVSPEMKNKVTQLMVEAQQVVVNSSFYVSDVPKKGPKVNRVLKVPALAAVPNSSGSSLNERIIKMEKNLLKVKSGEFSTSAIGLYDRNIIVNQHFIDMCEYDEQHEEFYFEMLRFGQWKQVRLSPRQIYPFEGKDLVVFQLPKGHTNFCDVRKYFAAEETLSAHGGHFVLVGRRLDNTIMMHHGNYTAKSNLKYGDEGEFNHLKCWNYVMLDEMKGMCGSPMWDFQTCSIVGLHIASAKNVTKEKYAMPISKSNIEEITRACDHLWKIRLQDETDVEVTSVIEPVGSGAIVVNAGIEKIGKATQEAHQHTVGKTKIVRSPIFGVFENKHEPAVLKMGDPRISEEARAGQSIHEKGINKYSEPIKPWKRLHRMSAEDVVLGRIALQEHKIDQRLLTEYEVLNGLADGSLKSIDMDASAGFPWVKRKPAGIKGKQNIFHNISRDQEKKEWVWAENDQAKEVKKRYEEMEQKMRQGENVFWLAYSNIKDELRSLEKVKSANSRSFDCVPIEVTLLFRKYFGTMIAQTHLNCAESPISVGIDPFTQWTTLAHRMLKRGDALIAGDYKNWDGSVSEEELSDAVGCINKIYNDEEENQNVREVLVYGATHMWCAVSDTIVRKHQGLPSGIPPTAVLNSLINWMRLLCAIQEIWEDAEQERLTPDELSSDIDMLLYGDDHVVSLTAHLREYVTFRTLRDMFTKHNITYTDSRKTGADFEFEKLEQLTYLKRTFVPYTSMMYIGPLDINSVLRQANWLHQNKRVGELDMLACVKNSLQEELALHGREVYNDAKKKYNEALGLVFPKYARPIESPYIITSFETAEQRIRERLGLTSFKKRDGHQCPKKSVKFANEYY